MRIRLDRSYFTIVTREGRHRQYSWLVVVPLVILPVAAIAAVIALTRDGAEGVGVDVENLLHAEPPTRVSAIPTIRLIVPNNTMLDMQRARGAEEAPVFNALLDDRKPPRGCEISLLGGPEWKTRPEKPSLALKIKRADAGDGPRRFELHRPSDPLALERRLAAGLAHERGLLSDGGEPVRVFINNKHFGVYVRTYVPGNRLTRFNRRVWGTYFTSRSSERWSTPDDWRSAGETDPASEALLRSFCAALEEPPTPASLSRLERVLDVESLALWAAARAVTATIDTERDATTLFVSPHRGRLEVVPTTVGGATADADAPVDLVPDPLTGRLSRDPRWVHARNVFIHALLTDRTDEAMEAAVTPSRRHLLADRHLGRLYAERSGLRLFPESVNGIPARMEEMKTRLRKRREFLLAYLDLAEVRVEPHPERPGRSLVHVLGAAAVAVEGPGPPLPEPLYPGLSADVERSRDAASGRDVTEVESVAMTYEVAAKPSDLRFANAITGRTVTPVMGPPPRGGETRTLHPSSLPPVRAGEVILGPGDVTIEEDLTIGAAQTLTVRAGTRLRLSRGVGIYSRGRVVVEGTAAAPVTIRAAGLEAWGALGLMGPATAGSKLSGLDVEGGSNGADGSARFKGMLSVYDCPDLTLEACRIGPGWAGEDSTNIVRSRVAISGCTWQDARMDGLDLEVCDGIVRDCSFSGCGDDGVDLMMCRVCIASCRIEASVDKGLSVSDDSTVTVVGSRISGCKTGLEVMDGSRVLLTETTFDGNDVAVRSHRQRRQFVRGGTTALLDCTVRNSARFDLMILEKCDVVLCRTDVDSVGVGDHRVTAVDALGPEWSSVEVE